jgi:hypothetical protein
MSQPEPVNATLQYVEGCPNWVEFDHRLRQALAGVGRVDTMVTYRQITTPDQAQAAKFRGSPTIRID